MNGVWMSSVYQHHQLGEKLGTRTKMYGREWDVATSDAPVATSEELKAMNLQTRGFPLPREAFPEADAVYNDKLFRRVGELFTSAGFFVARDRLAAILSQFDLGDGGLFPFPIYQSDLTTPYNGKFSLINIGARKNTIDIDACEDAKKFYIEKDTGQQIWKINRTNSSGRVVVSSTALRGADMWIESAVHDKIFMSDALVKSLQHEGIAEDWQLLPCQVLKVA